MNPFRAALLSLLSVLFVLSAACGDEIGRRDAPPTDADAAKPAGEGEDGASPPPDAGESGQTTIIQFNGRPYGSVNIEQVAEPTALSSFLPEDARDPLSWRMLAFHSHQGGGLSVQDPTTELAGKEVRVYAFDGAPAVGIFEQGASETPERFIIDTERIIVWTKASSDEEPETQEPTLEVRVVGRKEPIVLTLEKLSALEPMDVPETPGKPGAKRRGADHGTGWHLLDVAALAAPREAIARVTLVSPQGPLSVGISVLEHAEALPVIRFNRRGLVAFDLAGTGPSGKPLSGRAREVQRIEITLAE